MTEKKIKFSNVHIIVVEKRDIILNIWAEKIHYLSVTLEKCKRQIFLVFNSRAQIRIVFMIKTYFDSKIYHKKNLNVEQINMDAN